MPVAYQLTNRIVTLSVKVGLGLLRLYLWWGKPRLVTSRSRPVLVVIPKSLAMAGLSHVACPLVILPPPPSRFRLLALYCPLSWHPTAYLPPAGTLLLLTGSHPTARSLRSPLYPLQSTHSSSIRPSRSIALPLWLSPTPWSNDVITGTTVCLWLRCRPTFQWFSS